MRWIPASEIENTLSDIVNYKIKEHRENKYRVSSLPFCPVYALYQDYHPEYKVNYSYVFYTKIGNAVHALMQSFIHHNETINVFGSWECSACKRKELNCWSSKAKKLFKTCKATKNNCWETIEYCEVEVLYGPLSGHIDMILKIRGKIYLIDFKTIGSALWRTPAQVMKQRAIPSLKYYEQIETYAALLLKILKLRVDYYSIIYVGRDSIKFKNKPMYRGFKRKFTKKIYIKRMQRIDNFHSLWKLYDNFKKKPSRALREDLIKKRPCHTAEDYDKKMGYKFEFDPCPLWSNYTCRTDTGVDSFLKDIALLEKNKCF